MNCANCGAPLKLVLNSEYLVCEYCGSFQIIGKDQDGVQSSDTASNMNCPICHQFLNLATVENSPVLHCPNCKGLLFDLDNFWPIVEYVRRHNKAPAVRPPPVDMAGLDRSLDCPKCDQKMDTHLYAGPGNIIVDTCSNCHVIWLDYGEFSRIINAPGRDRLLEEDW